MYRLEIDIEWSKKFFSLDQHSVNFFLCERPQLYGLVYLGLKAKLVYRAYSADSLLTMMQK